jgi:MFS family permease
MSDLSPPVALRTATRSASRYALYVFLVLFAISTLNSLDRNILPGAMNIMSHELGLTIDQPGILASAFLISFTLVIIPLGIWSDRTKRKNVIAITVAVWSIITAFTALSFNFWSLFAARAGLGIGEAGYAPSSSAMMSDYFRREQRAKVMSWWSISVLVGLLLGSILGGVIADLFFGAWRWAFLIAAVPGLLLAFVAWRLREPRRNQADSAADEPALGSEQPLILKTTDTSLSKDVVSQFKSLLRIKTIIVLTIMQIFTFFVISGTVTYLSTFLQQKDGIGLSSSVAGIYAGFGLVLAGIAGALLGGYLSDWLNHHYGGARVLICGISYLLSAPSYAASVLIAINTHNLLLYTIFFLLTTVLLNINNGPLAAATQDVVPAALRASAISLVLFIGHALGDTFAPAMVGIVAHSFDPTGELFRQNMAGHALTQALIYLYPTSLAIAGVIGILGARWMAGDVERAHQIDRSTATAS